MAMVDPATWPSLRVRRFMALEVYVAHLAFVGLSAPKQEGDMRDKLSAQWWLRRRRGGAQE